MRTIILKAVISLIVSILLMTLVIQDDSHAGVFNIDMTTWKEFINNMEVKEGGFYDFKDSEAGNLVSGSLFTIEKNREDKTPPADVSEESVPQGNALLKIASVDGGYVPEDKAVITLFGNVRALELIPNFKIPFLPANLDVTVGIGGGYDFHDHDSVYGLAAAIVKINIP